MSIIDKIEASNSLNEINKLRSEVLELMKSKPIILKIWQDKFWSLKKCPKCGHIKK